MGGGVPFWGFGVIMRSLVLDFLHFLAMYFHRVTMDHAIGLGYGLLIIINSAIKLFISITPNIIIVVVSLQSCSVLKCTNHEI